MSTGGRTCLDNGHPGDVSSDIAPIQVARLDGHAAISRFVPEWERLIDADPASTVFQSPQMLLAWQSSAPENEEPLMLVARAGGVAIGCAALVLRSTRLLGVRTRTLAFGNPRGEIVAACRREEVIAALCGWLQDTAGLWDVLELNDIRPDTAHQIDAHFRRWGRSRQEPMTPAPAEAFLDTRCSWQAYLASRSAHFRHRLRPQTTKIERAGKVATRHFEGEAAAAVYEAFLELEASSWKSRSGDSRLPPRERDALRALLDTPSDRVVPTILFLDVDERRVAAVLSLCHRRTRYMFVTYFDDRLRAFYPGRRLFVEAVRDAFEHPEIDELSFIGAYPFAAAWASAQREYANLRIYGSGIRARLARAFAGQGRETVAATDAESAHA